ncbi:hypothetical protein CAPTEDRAFT_200648 [Capitella teleta]|uniref:Galactosyltransferase C-terminal domain-containing protein n=1 Tax=Capitella teleta TaxID=283909 RepID=R7U2B4_CAPTE|nr:hypothetical protein CAPTEDRAFT_200648 [Capitella teleta]|eukprot:ELU00145.1 hypothetical protein CAPTEDRAFT_200648 [Capitella teleta]
MAPTPFEGPPPQMIEPYEQRRFGGVTSFTPQQFKKVNGFSNNFFGWGGEDINMYYRIVKAGFEKTTPSIYLGRYTTIQHIRKESNARNCHNSKLMLEPTLEEGFSTVEYNVLQYEEFPLYTWLKIDINVRRLEYPDVHNKSTLFLKSNGSCKGLKEIATSRKKIVDRCLKRCEELTNCGTVFMKKGNKKYLCSFREGVCAARENNEMTSYVKILAYQCPHIRQIVV